MHGGIKSREYARNGLKGRAPLSGLEASNSRLVHLCLFCDGGLGEFLFNTFLDDSHTYRALGGLCLPQCAKLFVTHEMAMQLFAGYVAELARFFKCLIFVHIGSITNLLLSRNLAEALMSKLEVLTRDLLSLFNKRMDHNGHITNKSI